MSTEQQATAGPAVRPVRINQDLRPEYGVRLYKTSRVYVPPWLKKLLGAREREIIYHPHAQFLQEDQEGNRYPSHQQWIEAPVGTMLIDAKQRRILG